MDIKSFVSVMDSRRSLDRYGVVGMIRKGFLPRSLAENFRRNAGVDVLTWRMWFALIPTGRLRAYLVVSHFAIFMGIFHAAICSSSVGVTWGNMFALVLISLIAGAFIALLAERLMSKKLKELREAYHRFEFSLGFVILRCLPDTILSVMNPLTFSQFVDHVERGIGFLAEIVIIREVTYGPGTCQVGAAATLLEGVLQQAKAGYLIPSSEMDPRLASATLRLRTYVQKQTGRDDLKVTSMMVLPAGDPQTKAVVPAAK